MLGRLGTVERIGGGNDGLGKLGGGTFAKVLGHGDERDSMFLESPLGDDIACRIAEESRLAMDEHDIEGGWINGSGVHHRLKLRALVVSRTCAGIDKLPHHIPAARFAVLS